MVFVRSHSPRCATLNTRHYYYVSNSKLTDYLAELVVGPLLGIVIYSLFSMFNVAGKDKGSGKLARARKGS